MYFWLLAMSTCPSLGAAISHDCVRALLLPAGIVFTPCCEPYLVEEYGEEWMSHAPPQLLKLLHKFQEHVNEQVGCVLNSYQWVLHNYNEQRPMEHSCRRGRHRAELKPPTFTLCVQAKLRVRPAPIKQTLCVQCRCTDVNLACPPPSPPPPSPP